MDRKQARRKIDSLDYYLQNHTDDYGEESHTAMMMAIEALEQQPCDDAISRKAALDAMREETCGCCWDARYILAHLPSVNPQASKEDIHREREQAYMRGYEDASRKYRTEPSEDAISRQAVIDAMAIWDWQELYSPIHFKQLLEDLPSVSTEKTGRWIPVSEKLPEVNQRVLVTSYSRVCYAMMISADGNSGYPVFKLQDSLNERVICETTVHSEFTTSRITAWMPLPEPYRAESEVRNAT